jgi:photosystem II stability/assembly factor-like uncharacterized protein
MRGPGQIARVLSATLLCAGAASLQAIAKDRGIHRVTEGPIVQPEPQQDDATLHAVQCVGTQLAWAVGEHGSIWQTADGGRNWSFANAPVDCSLRSVCFLTDKIGWVVGGGISPYTRRDWGIVLGTQNGGLTWEIVAWKTVPYLHHVKFFGLEYGIALGEGSPQFPGGVLLTEDGGKTWQPMQGETEQSWRTGDFVDENTGYLGGPRGEHAPVGGGKLLPRSMSTLGLRGVHAIALQPDGSGWMAGDGGLAMFTRTAGAAWEEPLQPLPRELREFVDFRAVACRGGKVWVAGSPGSAVWHSPDAGRTWTPSATGDPAPIESLSFSSDAHGCAVGAFGKVLVTEDGGATWTAARGGNRRVALLALHAEAGRAPLRLVTRASGEQGYRTAVALVARRDVGPDGHLAAEVDLQLQDAVVTAGGCDSEIGWRLPLAAPELDRDYKKLTAEWMLLTDGRLPQVMLGSLVAQLRTWRPDVVVIDEPGEHDAAAKLLWQAMEHAVAQSADPSRYPEQATLAGLQSWQVKKVYVRLPAGNAGSVTVDPHEILPLHGKTLAMAAADAVARVSGVTADAGAEGYSLAYNGLDGAGWISRSADGNANPASNPGATGSQAFGRDFFSGLSLPVGGDARRATSPITQLDYDELERRAQHQRNFEAWSRSALDDEGQASQLIAQLGDVINGAPKDQAALQLAGLAEQHKRRSQWQLAEDTLIELVQRYPREPAALEAMQWLLALWTSQEMGWQRLAAMSIDRSQVTINAGVAQSAVMQAQQLQQQQKGVSRFQELSRLQNSPLSIQPLGGRIELNGQGGQRRLEASRWWEQALQLASTIERTEPEFYRDPEVQFTYAALLRNRGQFQQADEIYRRYTNDSDRLWQRTARGEMWVLGGSTESPKPVVRCHRVDAPPVLDGVLGDICWQDAMDIKLLPDDGSDAGHPDQFIETRGFTERNEAVTDRAAGDEARPLVMLAYDAQYLYFAASVPRSAELPSDPPVYPGRTHDAELAGYDQISLLLDVDRDYATYYRFDVDSRAQTREACWVDQKWDPTWYVACDGDPRRWTVEAAIPLQAIVPAPPGKGQTWAAGVVRTMPAEGVQSWTHPTGSVPRPVTFGLVRFD